VDSLGEWLDTLQKSFQFNSPSSKEIQRSGRIMLVNLTLMALLIGVGIFVLRFSESLGRFSGLEESIIGLATSAIVLALSVRSVSRLARIQAASRLTDRLSVPSVYRYFAQVAY
jgi:high-affinity Fe2+/Pb2+ permease